MDTSFAQKIPQCLSGRQQWFCSLLSPACPGPSEPRGHDRPPLMTRCGLALEVGAKWEQVGNLSQWAYHTHTREASTQCEAKERRGRVDGGGGVCERGLCECVEGCWEHKWKQPMRLDDASGNNTLCTRIMEEKGQVYMESNKRAGTKKYNQIAAKRPRQNGKPSVSVIL